MIRFGLVERDRREECFREPGGKRKLFWCLEGLFIRWMIYSSGLPWEAHSSQSGPAGYVLYHRGRGKGRRNRDKYKEIRDKIQDAGSRIQGSAFPVSLRET